MLSFLPQKCAYVEILATKVCICCGFRNTLHFLISRQTVTVTDWPSSMFHKRDFHSISFVYWGILWRFHQPMVEPLGQTWNGLAGTGVATAQKIVQRPTPFLTIVSPYHSYHQKIVFFELGSRFHIFYSRDHLTVWTCWPFLGVKKWSNEKMKWNGKITPNMTTCCEIFTSYVMLCYVTTAGHDPKTLLEIV